jgi:hypothetical protein
MGKTLRKFSKKGKKTQQRRKTKGRKQHKNRKTYGGGDCDIGEKINECKLDGEPVNNTHSKQLVNCFNSIAKTNFTENTDFTEKKNMDKLKKAYRTAAKMVHTDKGGDNNMIQQLNNAYNGLLKCEFENEDNKLEPEPEPATTLNQSQRLKKKEALIQKVYGDKCERKNPVPRTLFGYDITDNNNEKLQKRNLKLGKCRDENMEMINKYLQHRKNNKQPEFPDDNENITEFVVHNAVCYYDKDTLGVDKKDSRACEELENNANPLAGGSKKSNRKTKKVKYSKKK